MKPCYRFDGKEPADKTRCIAVIPARGGSKRLPRKNVRLFAGMPLITYTIVAACLSGVFERVIVSTDDEEIAKISREHGAEIPFVREQDLSDDFTPVSAVTVSTIQRLDPNQAKYRHVAQLMANCPLRTAEDIRESYRQFLNTRSDSQISVTRYGWQNPWWAMERSESFELKPLFEDRVIERSQDLPSLFCPTGAVWWAKADVLRSEHTYHVTNRTGWEIPWQRGIDIDTEDDWAMAELLMNLSKRVAEAHV